MWGRWRSHDGRAAALKRSGLPWLWVAAPLRIAESEQAVPTRDLRPGELRSSAFKSAAEAGTWCIKQEAECFPCCLSSIPKSL
ncbi:hypothetical protein NDU88_001803 [Pleurodeles waltl]|uniref:Secreted protein n=1 Tax=Pleurodeles waltl TaxID=8319 RepID=A0AAV7UV44_PLEWA|nr:hypothetical protein NDU88_001803 [Pleurodeles waltl]